MWLLVNTFGVLAVAVNYCFAINCYICDSSVNPKCVNLTDRSIKPEQCTYEKLVSDGNSGRSSWLMTVSELHYFRDSSTVEIPMVCQKIVGTDEQNQQTTLRRCQLENVSPCDFARNQVFKSGNKRIDHCSVCSTDSCNSAPSARASGCAAILLLVASVVAGKWAPWGSR